VPAYVAFLRAINLGARRRFPKAAIVEATEAAGGRDVETYINTGNVRLVSGRRSAAKVAEDLERAYLADRGFEVPAIVLTTAELADVAATAAVLLDEHGEPGQLSITLYADPPLGDAVAEVEALTHAGERAFVRGRAAYVFLTEGFHSSALLGDKAFARLGSGTARTHTVIREVASRWT
jgi:uncharacterized protein (DUF1697 family)